LKSIKFLVSESRDVLVSHSGLAMVGALLAGTKFRERVDAADSKGSRNGRIPNIDILVTVIGLLCLGKTDFAAVEEFRDDEFFKRSLELKRVPSEETLRQRMDEMGISAENIIQEISAEMVRRFAPAITPCWGEMAPLDLDVSPFDNSGSKKEGVGWTYKKVVGYAPNFAYLGGEGYTANVELRKGTQHCQKGTPEFLKRALELARRITDREILVRMDSGNDDIENIAVCRRAKAHWIVKRNLRRESHDEWLIEAQAYGEWTFPREGKEVYCGETHRERGGKLLRVIFEVTRRTIAADGQRLLLPDVEIDTYWSDLKATPEEIIALYRDHGTSEQFHSEFKTDMDLERLPSGKFDTNALVLQLGMIAYNVLRLVGQSSLTLQGFLPNNLKGPMGKKVKRRRLRSVIQDMMYIAAQLVYHGRRWKLSFGRGNPWLPVWSQTYAAFSYT